MSHLLIKLYPIKIANKVVHKTNDHAAKVHTYNAAT